MPPSRKRARVSPSTTTATPDAPPSSPPKPSTPNPLSLQDSFKDSHPPTPSPLQDPWTPAQETALFKLLIHHKPTGLHKHFHMLTIYNSLASQGLTHTRPSRTQPAAPIAHMMPAAIWEKLGGLYDLSTLDEREEGWRVDNVEEEGRETPPSAREEWVFGQEFELDGIGREDEAEEFARLMFDRRLKSESEASSPGVEARETETPPVVKERGKGGKKGSVRSSARQSGARRGSKTTTATTSTVDEEEEEEEEEADEEAEEQEEEKSSRTTRGATRQAAKKSKAKKKKKKRKG